MTMNARLRKAARLETLELDAPGILESRDLLLSETEPLAPGGPVTALFPRTVGNNHNSTMKGKRSDMKIANCSKISASVRLRVLLIACLLAGAFATRALAALVYGEYCQVTITISVSGNCPGTCYAMVTSDSWCTTGGWACPTPGTDWWAWYVGTCTVDEDGGIECQLPGTPNNSGTSQGMC